MLSEDLKQEIQTAYRSFLSAKSLRPRTGQRLMVAHIARMLGSIKRNQEGIRSAGDHLCAIEAGTGTGKTLAYTLAAIPIAKARDKTLVIATATIALQEQILFRDLPDILQHSGLDFSVSLAKGRRRYLCLSKLDQILSGGDAQTLPLLNLDDKQSSPDDANLGLYTQLAENLATGQWSGDRDAWDTVIDDQSWSRVTTDHAQCTGRRCSHVKQCSFFKARDSMGQADVVVANHDLVLADLALGGGAILPPPEDCIYIFDEAHHLPDKVINHFSANVRLGATERWFEQAERSLAAIISLPALDLSLRGPMETLMGTLSQSRKAMGPLRPMLEALLEEASAAGLSRGYRFVDGLIPEALASQSRDLNQGFSELVSQAEQLLDKVQEGLDKNHFKAPHEEVEQWLTTLSAIRYRCQAGALLWSSYASDASKEKPPQARWLAMVETGQGLLDIELNASPILAANALRYSLWSRCYGAVMTSATLTALGSFNRFSMRAGLASDASFEVVPSPFNHVEAGELYIPKMDCDAGDAVAHTEALINMLPTLLNPEEGSLVLFASRKQMRGVYEGLPSEWQARILAQDSLPKHEILSRHREVVDKGSGSVIFGLASFAEGVDLPGNYCSHVIIAKIPFSVPEDPVEEALAEWISRNNGNPFMEITVPDAAVRLVQASGRLLRKESDRGRITILDRRIVSRHYGRKILMSMPPYQHNIE
ncbi:DNA helicase, Rad3 [Spongiibacter sp. IMCC21906]|uniref:ATP-dependent DNA helicase DinG n=1 Tax=Spongiibacter sp. IMCC21906 TaxID=1620392 RepID=UPI00062DEB2F|nr:ATP-dependent DNA helicase DinG [Spongiibacter sp. IMCC21906]AKH68726.1 DNA helicase, Rad3 [Spongiibacter sp. IMCC21906]